MFPPGRARLSTSPGVTGSPTLEKTMGIVLVAFLAARVSALAGVMITSTLRRTSSSARAGSRSSLFSAYQTRKRYVLALDIADFRNSRWNTSYMPTGPEAERAARYPIFGIFAGCCATAGKPVARRIVARTTEIILLLIGFLCWIFDPLPEGEEKADVPCTIRRTLTLAPLQRAREKRNFNRRNPK